MVFSADHNKPHAATQSRPGEAIDLDRLVWDPEYRCRIKRMLKRDEISEEPGERRRMQNAERLGDREKLS